MFIIGRGAYFGEGFDFLKSRLLNLSSCFGLLWTIYLKFILSRG